MLDALAVIWTATVASQAKQIELSFLNCRTELVAARATLHIGRANNE